MADLRAYRKFTLSFGLVNVPVAITPLAESGRLESHRYCGRHKTRLKMRNFCEVCNRMPPSVEKGFEVGGEVVFTKEEDLLDLVEKGDKALHIEAFVPVEEIDPIYFDKSYLLWPERVGMAPQGYTLITEALREARLTAVGRIVLDKASKLTVLRFSPALDRLVLHVCHYHANLRWDKVRHLNAEGAADFAPEELDMALKLIQSAKRPFKPENYEDTYTEALRTYIRAKAQGIESPEVEVVEPVSILDTLRESMGKV